MARLRFLLQGSALVLILAAGSGCSSTLALAKQSNREVATAPPTQRFSLVSMGGDGVEIAQKVMTAMDNRDIRTLLGLCHPDEKRELRLDETKMAAMADFYLSEKKGFVNRGFVDCHESPANGAACSELFTNDSGEVTLTCPVFETNSGLRASVTSTLVTAIVLFRNHRITKESVTPDVAVNSVYGNLARIYRDMQAKLEPKGIDGLMFATNQKGALVKTKWDVLIRSAVRRRFGPSTSLRRGD